MEKLCKDLFECLGTAGNTSKIAVIPLDNMAKRSASGALDPVLAALVATG